MFWRGMPAPFSKGDARNTTCLTRRVGRPTLNHMVKYEENALDATFAALADPTRRAILARLAGREASVSERSEEHTSELQSPCNLVCRLLLEKKKKNQTRKSH